MKKISVSIPAILTTQMCLRLFIADPENTIRHQVFDVSHYYIDLPLRGNNPPDHEAVLRKLAKHSRTWRGGMIFAYQVVETSTLQQARPVRGHPVIEPSVRTTATFGKKVFVQGELVTKPKVRKLYGWVKAEAKKEHGTRDDGGFKARGISLYFKFSAPKFLKQRRHSRAIKIGEATLVAFNKRTMAFSAA